MLPEIGELVFSLVVGYMGALEFLYVVRHLYHWSFKHNLELRDYKSEAESLRKLQDQLKNAIAEAKAKEASGLKAMKDGVKYLDGLRIDDDFKKIEELKEKVRIQEKKAERQREIEAELERQRKIEEETRRQLKHAEEELRRVEEEKVREKQRAENEQRRVEEEKRKAEEQEKQRKRQAEEEENMKKMLEAERKKEEEQRLREEQEENERKLIEDEREREEKQRLQDIEDEKIVQKLLEAEREREREEAKKLLEAEKEREEIERQLQLDEENSRKLLETERQREEEQRLRELEEEEEKQKQLEEQRLLQLEKEREERERIEEEELQMTEKLIAAEKEAERKQREIEENEENMRNLLKVEHELELKKQEMEEEAENLRRLIEAEKEMEERQRIIDEEALQKLKNAQEEMELRQTYDDEGEEGEEGEAGEVPFVKKQVGPGDQTLPPKQTVKTQLSQSVNDSLQSKTLLFPRVSEESSSAEPVSSVQSSFSTQQSSEAVNPDLHFDEYERQAPDGGEDMPSLQYSDDYLRSLDGIKNKPLVREDGSGRRRAFKKRRSSGSSTSSRESRASREEELKMFTSLEEEESEKTRKGESEYEAIKYASEPNLKVTKQRRHKRSPAKDAKRDANEGAKGSLEMLDEEESNPWGEVKPEHYKNTEFWKREKNLSIDEELDTADANQRVQSPTTEAIHLPKMSSFEEATKSQHEEAISVLKRQRSKDPEPIKEPEEESDTKNVSKIDDARKSPTGSFSPPASASASVSPALISPEPKRERSLEAEEAAARTPSPTTGLRRSPRVDEMKQYEEKWKSDDRKAHAASTENPAIEIDLASDEETMPQPDELLMEGISDFYDFNASINPARSRSRSRSKTPAVNRSVSLPERRTSSPQNVSHSLSKTRSRSPSPDPASYKFIYQRILPSLDTYQPPLDKADEGLSDFYDFNTKLNRETLTGLTKHRRSSDVHRTSVDYVLEDLRKDQLGEGLAIAKQLDKLRTTPHTPDYERSISEEMRDIDKLKEEMLNGNFKRSTYVGESMDFSDEFAESLREEAKHFRRSRSRSRSPVYDDEQMTARVLARKQLQANVLDDIIKTSENVDDFSNEITKSFVDRNRRASDTALIQKPEIFFQIQDLVEEIDENFNIIDLEGDEYHHFRRFSLGQEIPVEQYPEDFTYISEIKALEDLSSWKGESESQILVEGLPSQGGIELEENLHSGEEAYESGSDDERQTVVEVDDEIDEDIWDYNERTEESHNEQSECEEADREMDRYAGRNADDWRDVEGAVGGVSDEDSFQIDQIYDEAIKNRKPSGIERDYDCILQEIQISDEDRLDEEIFIEKPTFSNGNSGGLDPGLWSPRSRSSRASSRESSRSFIEYEKRDNERRYLADPTMEAINSTRLRSRYGIVPSTSLPTGFEDNDITDVDVNYVPKKEYKWRKNFKLDDDPPPDKKDNSMQLLDTRKFSLGGESITLFSQSPDHSDREVDRKRENNDSFDEEIELLPEEIDKPSKKKKSKRKSRKGSKGSLGGVNEDENETLSRRNSIVTENDLPKKKSRRGSKALVDDIPESSAMQKESLQDDEAEDLQSKKKSKKKRKQAKDEITLPKLDIVIPTPQKKAPPPSVAAIRAALSDPPAPPEVKTPTKPEKPKKLWDTKAPSTEVKSAASVEKPKRLWEVKTASPEPKNSTASEKPKKLWEDKTPSPSIRTSVDLEKPSMLEIQKDLTPSASQELSTINDSEMIPSIDHVSTSSNTTVPSAAKSTGDLVLKNETGCRNNSEPLLSEPSPLRTKTSDSSHLLTSDEAQVLLKVVAEVPAPTVGEKENTSEPVSLENSPDLSHVLNSTTSSTLSPPPFQKSRSRTPEPIKVTADILEDAGLYPLVTKADHTQSQNTPESDIIKDGSLYPLF